MKAYRVIKATNDARIWHPILEEWVGEILHESDIGWNPYYCESEDWMIIKTGDTPDAYDQEVMPIIIHKSCLEELDLCICEYFQVLNTGCICGGY